MRDRAEERAAFLSRARAGSRVPVARILPSDRLTPVLLFFTSLRHYFFTSLFLLLSLSLRTVFPQEPRNAFSEIFIQLLAYY